MRTTLALVIISPALFICLAIHSSLKHFAVKRRLERELSSNHSTPGFLPLVDSHGSAFYSAFVRLPTFNAFALDVDPPGSLPTSPQLLVPGVSTVRPSFCFILTMFSIVLLESCPSAFKPAWSTSSCDLARSHSDKKIFCNSW